jgi:hypothetical protein
MTTHGSFKLDDHGSFKLAMYLHSFLLAQTLLLQRSCGVTTIDNQQFWCCFIRRLFIKSNNIY